ncbi:EB module family protein [Acanthocheilonema viteae]
MYCMAYTMALLICIQACNGIGRLCRNGVQCPDGQYCIWGKCLCFNGQVLMNDKCIVDFYCRNGKEVYHNGQCYYLAAIGDKCLINEQCYGESFCVNSSCTCLHETVNVNGLCLKSSPHSTSQCEIHQVLVKEQCLNIAVIGEICQVDAQCSGGANCLNQRCSCPPGTVQNEQICRQRNCSENEILINGTCLSRVIPGEQCKDSAQCLDGSKCSSIRHACICLEGMNNIGGYCRKLSYTDPCDSVSLVYANESCVPIVKPGDQCIYDLQCLGGSLCTDGYCNCRPVTTNINGYCVGSMLCNHHEIFLNNQCFKRLTLNESCLISQQCPNNAICNYEARCVCPIGMVVMNGQCQPSQINYCKNIEVMVNGRCVKRRVPGTTCIANEQCLDESNCSNGYCKCANGTKLLSRYCIRRNGTEKCDTYQTYVNEKCLDLAIPGEDCIDDLQCLAASICRAGKCVCPNGYIEVKKYCVRDLRPSTGCNNNQVLINGHCYDFAKIGQYCINTAVCLGTVPQNNICISSGPCATGQIYIAESCWDIASIGEECEFTQQCQGYSTCINDRCQCPSDTAVRNGLCTKEQCNSNEVMIDGICFNTVKIDDFCYHTKQCQRNATCQRGKCTCPPGTINSNNTCIINTKCQPYQISVNDTCLDTVSIGMTCQDNSQCIESASCVPGINLINSNNRTCQCNNGMIFNGAKCLASPIKCPVSTVYVVGKVCYPLVEIGQFCLYAIQCMGYSVCSGYICKCPLGYTAIHNVCRRIN